MGLIETQSMYLFIVIAMVLMFLFVVIFYVLRADVLVRTSEASSFSMSFLRYLIWRDGGIINTSNLDPVALGEMNCKYEAVIRGWYKTYHKSDEDMSRVATQKIGDIPVLEGNKIKNKKAIVDIYAFPQYFCYFYAVWESGKPLSVSICKNCDFKIFSRDNEVCVDDGNLFCKALPFTVSDFSGKVSSIVVEKKGNEVVVVGKGP